eukprot:5796883-Pyramimonas_sp.AAC.1
MGHGASRKATAEREPFWRLKGKQLVLGLEHGPQACNAADGHRMIPVQMLPSRCNQPSRRYPTGLAAALATVTGSTASSMVISEQKSRTSLEITANFDVSGWGPWTTSEGASASSHDCSRGDKC